MADLLQIIEQLGATLVDTVKSRASDFLEKNPEAKAFVEERAKRAAKLGVEYLRATTDDERASIERSLKLVRQSIENEVDGLVLVVVTEESKALFKSVLGAVFDTFTDALPVLVKLIPLL